jgi:hypothetical protein
MRSMKTCTRCRRRLSLTSFAEGARTVDGRRVWCNACVDKLTTHPDLLTPDYQRDAQRAYQLWFRSSSGREMIDRRLASKNGIEVALRWSRRRLKVRVEDGWRSIEKLRQLAIAAFDCDPMTIAEHGRGGGTGMRRHVSGWVEGDCDEDKWKHGSSWLVAHGWTVRRAAEGVEVASGY